MKNLQRFLFKSRAKHPAGWRDALRVALGLLIHLKSLLFIDATAPFIRLVEIYGLDINDKWLLYTIGTINLVGGTFIILGLQTRIMVLIQIPFILASVVFASIHTSGFYLSSEVWLSLVILLGCCFFFIEGSGKFSVDEYIRNNYKTLTSARKNNPQGESAK